MAHSFVDALLPWPISRPSAAELWDAAGISRDQRIRYTFATHLLRAGVDLATLRDLLGHSDTSVTSRYLAATPQRHQAVSALAGLPGPK